MDRILCKDCHDEERSQEMPEARLPRTLAHWLASNGLRVTHIDRTQCLATSKRREHVEGCVEPVRHFRFLGHLGKWQVCDGFKDRWANSVGNEAPIPRTKAEFDKALPALLAGAELAVVDHAGLVGHLERQVSWAEEALLWHTERLFDMEAWRNRHGSYRQLTREIGRERGRVAYRRARLRTARRALAHEAARGAAA